MFGKKVCGSCNKKINEKYSFCPHCGNSPIKRSKEDEGMLGNDDFVNEFENFSNTIFGGVGSKIIGKMFENAMKVLEKEMEKEVKRNGRREIKRPKTNFQLFINGQKVNGFENHTHRKPKQQREIQRLPQNVLSKFSNLPQKSPKTDVRRLSDKVVYEINMPGVNSLKDVSITKLENNIEIRAISKNKAYQKMIPVNFPIIDYTLSKGKLILEFDAN